jgi:flagellar hook protein FlgE
MLQSLFSGSSGLRAHQTQMDVIGNNIANINTVGFKASRAEFKQALSRTLRGGTAPGVGSSGGTDPMQIGLGVSVGSIGTIQTQGSLQSTGRTLDMAIEGDGFLTLSDGARQFYSRDGALTVDGNGTLTTGGSAGLQVLGWNADPATGAIDTSGTRGAIKLQVGQAALARQTSAVQYAGNLDSSAATATTASTTYKIYDSLGTAHTLSVKFEKSATAGEWTWTATSGSDTFDVSTGTITFDTNGKVLTGGTATPTLTLATPGGAAPAIKMSLDFSGMTSLAGNGASTVNPTSQDGLPLGTLSSYSIDPTGIITGSFSNGMTQAIAQVSLASFTNPNGLTKIGGNMFSESADSGLPQIGTPTSGGRGKISSGYLEMSNVDLSTEFTNMIVAQRGFQANSKIITSSDELLQDLIALKR